MNCVIRPVRYTEILDAPNAQKLLQEYADECSIPEIGDPTPQVEQYALLEDAGVMHTFAAYEGEELVGFAAVLTSVLPHYSRKVATLESIFISPKHRKGTVGRTLMLVVEQFADVQGCSAVLYTAPTGSRFGKLLAHLPGYRNTNAVYCRSLN